MAEVVLTRGIIVQLRKTQQQVQETTDQLGVLAGTGCWMFGGWVAKLTLMHGIAQQRKTQQEVQERVGGTGCWMFGGGWPSLP